ncbi:hypothetical protein D3C83_78260 [compost metagenome]
MFDFFFGRDCLREQRIARPAPEFIYGRFVECLDLEHFIERHIRDFLERGEAFLHQDVGNLLIDVELLHENRADTARLFLGFLL